MALRAGLPCPLCGVTFAANCGRCHTRLDADNRPLTPNLYGCEHCRGERLELLGRIKGIGQEEEAHLLEQSKANAG